MLTVRVQLDRQLNLDKIEGQSACPKCGFFNPIWLKQVRLRDAVICRGCKTTVHLEDTMASLPKVTTQLRRTMDHLRAGR